MRKLFLSDKVKLPNEVIETSLDKSPINMDDIDNYMGIKDVQYIDLREFSDKLGTGYVRGFEFVPFFGFLDGRMVVRDENNVWDLSKAKISEEFKFENYFDKNKIIFLMCASGVRAGFVKGILDAQGYITYNIGGFNTYTGENKAIGDESFTE